MPVFGDILVRIFKHSDWIRQISDQNNSVYGHSLRSVNQVFYVFLKNIYSFFYESCHGAQNVNGKVLQVS